MSDEPTNTNVEEVVADEPQTEVEETVSEQAEITEDTNEEATPTEPEADAPQEESKEEAPETAVAEEKAPSRREQKRVRDLLTKYPELGEASPPKREDKLDYQSLEADPELIQQLEADRQREGQTQYQAGLEQAKSLQYLTRLEIDAPKVESKYPKLNPDSPDFDALAADDINSLYLELTGYDQKTGKVANPNLRYADFVEVQMALSDRLATQKVEASVKNVAKQAAATGLRPDGSSAKRLDLSKDPSNMSIEELYASIGQKPPK